MLAVARLAHNRSIIHEPAGAPMTDRLTAASFQEMCADAGVHTVDVRVG